jgi:hypothetical protein
LNLEALDMIFKKDSKGIVRSTTQNSCFINPKLPSIKWNLFSWKYHINATKPKFRNLSSGFLQGFVYSTAQGCGLVGFRVMWAGELAWSGYSPLTHLISMHSYNSQLCAKEIPRTWP